MPDQTSVAIATCRPLNRAAAVSAAPAPTATWSANTTSVARAAGRSAARRIAEISTYTRRTPIARTAPRCSIVNAFAPLKSNVKPLPQSGQARHVSSAELATTVDPVRSIRNVAPAPIQATRRNERSGAPDVASSDITAVAMRKPRMTIASPRCATTSHGASSLTTTTPPSAPSAAIATSEEVPSHATRGRWCRNAVHASTTVAMSRIPVTAPTVRCEYSMIEWTSAAG